MDIRLWRSIVKKRTLRSLVSKEKKLDNEVESLNIKSLLTNYLTFLKSSRQVE